MIRLLRSLFGRSAAEPPSPEFLDALERAKKEFLALGRPAVVLSYETGTPVLDGPTSSIGGRPSLPPDLDWPVSKDGRPMLFLAQLAFEELPALEHFPTSGLVSLFVADNAQFGLSYSDTEHTSARPNPDDIAVLWFDEPGGLERRELPVRKPKCDMYGRDLRVHGASLLASRYTAYPSVFCFEFDEVAERHLPGHEGEEFLNFVEALSDERLHIGGYPAFTQDDIRDPAGDPPLSEVLLQVGFVSTPQRHWDICWGDAGEATFLMTKEDLVARRFDCLTYSWDCH